MLRGFLIFVSVLVASLASLYQFWLKDFLAVTLGVGREIQKIESFPYTCRRLEHERLEACEDLWLDDDARVLYVACTGTKHRMEWNAAMDKLNLSGRRPGGSELIALDVDSPGDDGFYGLRAIKPLKFTGAVGNELDLVGFDAEVVDDETIHFYLINQRPPVDTNGNLVDPMNVGANATIDIFELKRGENSMKHLRTVWSPEIWSPNRVAILGFGSFVVTNDHSTKLGLRKQLHPILGGGNVAYCAPSGACHAATTITLKFPNGLTRGADGLIYVPSSVDGHVRVFELLAKKTLNLVDTINIGMPLDNLALDAKGDLFVAGFPDFLKGFKWLENPIKNSNPSTIFRIRKTEAGYQVHKVLEDGEAKVASGTTTARHDTQTGRLFLGSALSPYLTVCEPKGQFSL